MAFWRTKLAGIGAVASIAAPPCATTQARAMRSWNTSVTACWNTTRLPCRSHITEGVELWP